MLFFYVEKFKNASDRFYLTEMTLIQDRKEIFLKTDLLEMIESVFSTEKMNISLKQNIFYFKIIKKIVGMNKLSLFSLINFFPFYFASVVFDHELSN